MVKALNENTVKRLKSKGARTLDSKKPIVESDDLIKIKRLAIGANRRAEAAETEAKKAVDLAKEQVVQMQSLIDKIPVSESLPPITGFTFQRGSDGSPTGVTFIRDKKVIN